MLKKLWAVVAIAAVAATTFAGSPTEASAAVNVYTTPGYHKVNGREWKTACNPYSSVITRCRAEIKSGGEWRFNNLTYTTTTHRAWGDNQLANPGFFTSGGRKWVTSCNDNWTGPNGCRSLIWDTEYNKWVFNNLVELNSTPFPTSSFNADTGRFATQYATAKLNLWNSATSTGHNGAVAYGTAVAPTGTITAGRAQVVVNGTSTWVTAKHLDIKKPKPAPASPAPSTPSKPAPSKPTPPQRPASTGGGYVTTTSYTTAALNIWDFSTGDTHTGLIKHGAAVQTTGVLESGRAQIALDGMKKWVTAQYLTPERKNAGKGPGPGGIGSGDTSLNRGWSSGLHQVNANATKVVRHVWAVYPDIKTMYGWAQRTTPDHPAGRAVDVMIPRWNTPSGKETGWEMANFYRANAEHFGIQYIIFDQRIWNIQRDREGWRRMANRGNNSANHKDHLHINTYDDKRYASKFSQPDVNEMGDIHLDDLGDVGMDELGDIDVAENFE